MIKPMTKKELSEVAGYTYRRLHEIDTALPENQKLFVREEEGKYSLPVFVQRWVAYNVDHEVAGFDDIDQIKAKHEKVKTMKTEIEVDRLRGKLVDVADVKALWGNVANTVVQNLLHVPHKLAPMLQMIDNTELIASIIDDEIRTVLNNLSDTPLPEEADFSGEQDTEDEVD